MKPLLQIQVLLVNFATFFFHTIEKGILCSKKQPNLQIKTCIQSSSFIELYTSIDGFIVFPMYIFAVCRANLLKEFFLNKFSTNESTRIITGHVIYNPAYTYKFQLKSTFVFPKRLSQGYELLHFNFVKTVFLFLLNLIRDPLKKYYLTGNF